MHKLYYAKGTAAFAAHIALEETGADYEALLLDFSKNEQQGEAFLKINPKARVPALITPQGILTETPAILAYIAQTWPQSQLAPTDPFEFAEVQAFNNYMASSVHVAHAHRKRGARWADDASAQESMRAKVAQNMHECMALIDTEYFKGPWVMGEKYSICDPYLFLICGWLPGDGVNLDDFPRLSTHQKAMLARPAVAKINQLHA